MATPTFHDLAQVDWQSGVSASREGYPPFVTMRVTASDGHIIMAQLDLDTVRDIGMAALQAMNAADTDAAVFRMAIKELDLTPETAGMLVMRLREHRQTMKGQD